MHYRSVAQLSDQVWSWSEKLPKDLDLVVGIPRSGLLAANLVALYRNLPLTDVDGLLEGRVIANGSRRLHAPLADLARPLNVLVVDDSVCKGRAMQEVKERIAAAGLPHRMLYGAVYVRPGQEQRVDFYAELLEIPRLFEWNFMHHKNRTGRVCMDIDGVLCGDPPREANDDGPRYSDFLACAEPLHVPTEKVAWLVTCRLEKYRQATEEWLARHGIQYGELIMMDLPDQDARRAAGSHSAYKADVYRRTNADLFYESSLSQAIQIANLALKPVFCVDTRQMIYPGSVPQNRLTIAQPPTNGRLAKAARRRVRRVLSRLGIL